jgi:hypothetical protein
VVKTPSFTFKENEIYFNRFLKNATIHPTTTTPAKTESESGIYGISGRFCPNHKTTRLSCVKKVTTPTIPTRELENKSDEIKHRENFGEYSLTVDFRFTLFNKVFAKPIGSKRSTPFVKDEYTKTRLQ